ncbi:flagellar brake protein [Pseudoneobacillus sp. C159]
MYLKVNQTIIVSLEIEDRSFQSIVAEVSEKEFKITLPVEGIELRNLPAKTKVAVFFYTEDNQFKCQTEILGKTMDQIPLYRIQMPPKKDIIKIQRRDNFRVKSNLSLQINDLELSTINISAGGMLFSCSKDQIHNVGDVVSGILFIPGVDNKISNSIPFTGKIKRIHSIAEREIMNVALEFFGLNNRDQQSIVQYCFQKQKQNRLIQKNL